MYVIKRDGRREAVKFDKITARIEKLCYGLHMDYVSPIEVAKKVIDGIYDGVTTVELDNLAAETAAHPAVFALFPAGQTRHAAMSAGGSSNGTGCSTAILRSSMVVRPGLPSWIARLSSCAASG